MTTTSRKLLYSLMVTFKNMHTLATIIKKWRALESKVQFHCDLCLNSWATALVHIKLIQVWLVQTQFDSEKPLSFTTKHIETIDMFAACYKLRCWHIKLDSFSSDKYRRANSFNTVPLLRSFLFIFLVLLCSSYIQETQIYVLWKLYSK